MSPGAGSEGFLSEDKPLAQTRKSSGDGGAMEGGEFTLVLGAGGQFPGQFVQTGTTDAEGGFLFIGLRAAPIELNETAGVIERHIQTETGAAARRQIQFRLFRLS